MRLRTMRLSAWTTAALAAAALGAPACAAARDLTVEVDGRSVYLGRRQSCYLDRGVWMIPAIPVLRAGDVGCRWNSYAGELEVWTRYERILLFADSYTAQRGPHREVISRPVAVHHGEPFLPVDFLERCLDRRAYYDRSDEVLCFGWRDSGRFRDGWRRDRRDRNEDRCRRDMEFRVDPPGRHGGSSVRIQGRWGGTGVRIRVFRENGQECISRSVGARNGDWYFALSLSSGKYRAVVEAMDGRVLAHRREMEFVVR